MPSREKRAGGGSGREGGGFVGQWEYEVWEGIVEEEWRVGSVQQASKKHGVMRLPTETS